MSCRRRSIKYLPQQLGRELPRDWRCQPDLDAGIIFRPDRLAWPGDPTSRRFITAICAQNEVPGIQRRVIGAASDLYTGLLGPVEYAAVTFEPRELFAFSLRNVFCMRSYH